MARRRWGALLLLGVVVLVEMVARGEASPTDKEDRAVLVGGRPRRAEAGVVGGIFCLPVLCCLVVGGVHDEIIRVTMGSLEYGRPVCEASNYGG